MKMRNIKLFIFKKENNKLHDVIVGEEKDLCMQYAKELYGNEDYYFQDTWDYVLR